jgi:phytoene dehydrogenase-like protein
MPIKNMYIAGPSTSPGGGATCGSRAAVPVIMEDLGMDFGRLVG